MLRKKSRPQPVESTPSHYFYFLVPVDKSHALETEDKFKNSNFEVQAKDVTRQEFVPGVRVLTLNGRETVFRVRTL